jgi:ribosome maturation factor RimP
MKNIIDKIKDSLAPSLKETGLTIYDITFLREGSKKVLRVLLDKEGGVNMDECTIVNKAIGLMLEESDSVDDTYTVEVNSPGIDRPLREKAHYEKVLGKEIEVKLFSAINKKKTFVGYLKGLTDKYIVIEDDKGLSEKIDLEKISKAKVYFKG